MLPWPFARWRKDAPAQESFSALFIPPEDDDCIALDTETTGLDPKQAEIIAIAAIRIRGSRLLTSEALQLLVKPERPGDPGAILIHGLRPADLHDALDIGTALRHLAAFIGSRPLIGYYLDFDVAVINRALWRLAGITLPNRRIEVAHLYHDRALRRQPTLRLHGEVDLRLETIRETLSLPAFPRHAPILDAAMAGLIYLKLRPESHTAGSPTAGNSTN